jgi:hypothetical protein
MMNGQMDPLAMALLARQQQGQGGETGPVLLPQQSQQMGSMISQGGGAPGGGIGQGLAAAGHNFADAYKQKMAMDAQAQQAGRNKLLVDALTGGIKPGVGPGGMGSMSFGGPR